MVNAKKIEGGEVTEEVLDVTNPITGSGAFMDSLRRNNKQIRHDRALAIAEDTELLYKREIEDLDVSLRRLKRDQDNMLDLSPTDARSLKLASDFNSKEFVDKDIALGVKIRNTQIKLEIARAQYTKLFGIEV